MSRLCTQHGLPTAPLASRLMNQRAAAPWITLPWRQLRCSVTAVSATRHCDFGKNVTV